VTDRIFVDTSILVRAHDLDAGERRAVAQHILLQLWDDKTGVLGALVLQEFYASLVGRSESPVPRRAARELVDAYRVWPTVALEPADILAASELEERHRLPFRDAMIVAAARKARATVLLSEQILPARHITGLDVQNPFS
jgi:predicted nucleic acid-binding protein